MTGKAMKITASQRKKICTALEHHDKFSSAYFWTPPGNASGRRHMEKANSFGVKFKNGGHTYEYTSDVSCSCKNVYYTGSFVVDGKPKNRRAFAALLPKALQAKGAIAEKRVEEKVLTHEN